MTDLDVGTGATVDDAALEDLGPVDYVVLEWPDRQPAGEVAPHLLALSDSGTIRILDIAIVAKDADGSLRAIDIGDLDGAAAAFNAFGDASSGLLDFGDLQEASKALEPGTCAAVIVWENRWAAPVARAMRESGGQLVASGRIPVQALLASLDALEATT